jgi:hypothetical protein
VVGIAVYVSAGSNEQVPFELTDEAKRYTYQLEQSGGQFALMVHQINESVAGAFHGAALGITIGVLATIVALCWFLVARRR